MGLSTALVGKLFTARRQSDVEMQLQFVIERRMALLDKSRQVSSELSNSIFSQAPQTAAYGNNPFASANGNATPDQSFMNGVVGYFSQLFGINQTPQIDYNNPAGINYEIVQSYEERLADLQANDKALEVRQRALETELKIIKTMYDSHNKSAKENAKNSFKIG